MEQRRLCDNLELDILGALLNFLKWKLDEIWTNLEPRDHNIQGAFFILVIADVDRLSHRRNILYFDPCQQSGVLCGLYENIDCSSRFGN